MTYRAPQAPEALPLDYVYLSCSGRSAVGVPGNLKFTALLKTQEPFSLVPAFT